MQNLLLEPLISLRQNIDSTIGKVKLVCNGLEKLRVLHDKSFGYKEEDEDYES